MVDRIQLTPSCEDLWHDNYAGEPRCLMAPRVPPAFEERVLCGGQVKLLTPCTREPAQHDYASTRVGFRMVCAE